MLEDGAASLVDTTAASLVELGATAATVVEEVMAAAMLVDSTGATEEVASGSERGAAVAVEVLTGTSEVLGTSTGLAAGVVAGAAVVASTSFGSSFTPRILSSLAASSALTRLPP